VEVFTLAGHSVVLVQFNAAIHSDSLADMETHCAVQVQLPNAVTLAIGFA
jgi:hypothetical protein